MGKKKTPALATLPVPRSLIASASQIKPNEPLWSTYRFNGEAWQTEAWRFFRHMPELHYAAEYIGSACSRVRIFVAELDELGRPGDEVDDDEEVMAISDTLFGGPAEKSQALKLIGVNLTVAGECYIVGRARRDADPDAWMIASTTMLKRRTGAITINYGYGPEKILPSTDLVIRLWTPDPERIVFADSPTHACLEVLTELEQLQLFERSQIDSRLAGAGIYFLPAEMSNGPSDASTIPQSADDVFQMVAEAARAARSQQGTAASVVPIFIEIPGEYLQHMQDKPVRFESELSDKLKDLKDTAIRRLANGLNMPPEVLLGMGDANHWSAWHVEESFVKIQIEPLMNLICQGLTKAYLGPLLKAMGKDPTRYMFSFDTAPLTVRPNRLQDTLNLYERRLVNAEAVLAAGNYNPATDAMGDEESTQLFIRALMERDPTLIAVPTLVEAAGLDIPMPEPVLAVPGDPNQPGPPPPPAPTRSVEQPNTGPPTRTTTSAGGGTPILASGEITYAPDPILAASNVTVRRALEIAGGSLLTRQWRGQFPAVPKFELHTKIKVSNDQAVAALSGAFDWLELDFAGVDVNVAKLRAALISYCTSLIVLSEPHDIERLGRHLTHSGVVHV